MENPHSMLMRDSVHVGRWYFGADQTLEERNAYHCLLA